MTGSVEEMVDDALSHGITLYGDDLPMKEMAHGTSLEAVANELLILARIHDPAEFMHLVPPSVRRVMAQITSTLPACVDDFVYFQSAVYSAAFFEGLTEDEARRKVELDQRNQKLRVFKAGWAVRRYLRAEQEKAAAVRVIPAPASSAWYLQHCENVRLFWEHHPVEPSQRKSFLLTEIQRAITGGNEDRVCLLIDVVLDLSSQDKADVLNEVLLIKGHRRHQELVREIQSLADPSSVPYLCRLFDEEFHCLADYNGSGTGVVAKWFSHALFSIGTPEAIEALRFYARHPDDEVREEMLYRLSKLE